MNDILQISKNLGIRHNVSFRVIDQITGKVVQEHQGHNAATNSLLTGIAHYLVGDSSAHTDSYRMFQTDEGFRSTINDYIPRYISLGTMGLLNQEQDTRRGSNYYHLPLGIGGSPSTSRETIEAYQLYMNQCPGYGADGYDLNLNNNRLYPGLGLQFSDRKSEDTIIETLQLGDINQDGVVDINDLLMLIDYNCGKIKLSEKQKKIADVTKDGNINCEDVQKLKAYVDGDISLEDLGTISYNQYSPTINCELISKTFPRQEIAYREIVPEIRSELPKTIDIVYSAMISTGALKQFREPDKDYIFITEAGLWSKQEYIGDGGDNGLLAGYRIIPPNSANWDMTKPINQRILQKSILRVGINQVVQVIWKIQLGAIEELYPTIK